MSFRKINREYALYGAAFLLALVIRLAGAARFPLTDREAELALQALGLSQGQALLIGPHPAYLALTTVWMFIFHASNWVARFWPALAGSLLVLLPLFYRGRLGKLPALLLAFFLAVDPGLLAISRQAGSLSLAIFFTMLALGLWLTERKELAGIAFGMVLLSGPSIWPGMISLGLALLIARRWIFQGQGMPTVSSEPGVSPALDEKGPSPKGDLRRGLVFALVTVFLVGTLFFSIPNGLSAVGASIPTYLQGWVPGSGNMGVSLPLVFGALVVYEFLPLIFGLWGGIGSLLKKNKTEKDRLDQLLIAWWAISLILILAYPGRQVQDLAWSILPLWALAARQIARLFRIPAADRLPVLGQMTLSAIIIAYISMQLVTITNTTIDNPLEYQVRLAGGVVMLAACSFLIAWGWARAVAMRGVVLGIGLIFLVYSIAAGWNAAGLSSSAGDDLWSSGPLLKSADLITETIANLSQWGPTQTGGPDVVVVDISSPALRWLLRGVQQISYVSQEPAGSRPAIAITAVKSDPALSDTYRGESFILYETVNWKLIKLKDWFRWAALRVLPGEVIQQNRVILWARTDLFPGGSTGQNGQDQANP